MSKKIPPNENELKDGSKNQDKSPSIEDKENNIQVESNSSQIEKSLEDFGSKIRATRIANNLSLESVSGHLHISVKILEAIEEGNPEKGPTPVFFRGLVRTYCQFLELDKTEFIDKIEKKLKDHGDEEKINIENLKPVFNVKESFPIRNVLTFLVIFLGGFIIYYFFSPQTKFDENFDNATIKKIVSEEIPSEKEIKTNILQKTQEESSKKENKINSSIETKKISNVKKLPEKVKILSPTNENYEPLTLEVEASEGTWISVAIDNSETRDYRIGADEIQQWVAKKNFLLTIGNTNAVRILLNGREIETNRTHDLLSNWLIDSKLLP
tara:strand:+ start:49 stop:1026 length:978 start_codon:yes stop_codon:yes gene_type:complete